MRERTSISIPYLQEKACRITYDNGFTLVYVPKKGDVFNISTWVKTGSIHEDDQISGISHFLEHLLFKGTERFKPGEFDRLMESMGAIINAATWKDFTYYYVTGPQGSNQKNFDLALDMHADMMLHSTIPNEEVGPPYDPLDPNYQGEKRERSVVIEEIGMREDQPWTKIYNSVNHMMYPDQHPYQRDVIGTRQIIGKVPRDTIYHYYRTWYTPEHMTTIIVGNFDLDTLEAKVQRHFDFSNLPMTPGHMLNNIPTPRPNGKRYEEIPGEYQTAFFITGYHGPNPKDLKDTIALDVVSHILGESRSSRLNQALIEKPSHPLFNYVSTGQSTFKLGNVFFVQGNFNTHDPQAALKQVHEEVERMLTADPITQNEFQRAVKKLRVDFAETSETASGIAESIGESMTLLNDMSLYIDYLNALNQLDVATVNAVARKYLSPDNTYTSVLVPEHG